MIRIAIVEDDSAQASLLEEYLERYREEHGEGMKITVFPDGLEFVDNYRADYDLVLMDIEMPHLDGLAAARKMRMLDTDVCLIFITNMAQYALKGYEVGATDFLVKPVGYFDFSLKLRRALTQYSKYRRKIELRVHTPNGFACFSVSDVYYIESADHQLIYHTVQGCLQERGSIGAKEKELSVYHFARCNNCYLVNLEHVSALKTNSVFIAGEELAISRSKKKEFLKTLTDYMGNKL